MPGFSGRRHTLDHVVVQPRREFAQVIEDHVGACVDRVRALSTKDDAEKTADRVLVQILSTDETLPPKDRMIKKTEKNGLYEALNIASIWLERSLNPSA